MDGDDMWDWNWTRDRFEDEMPMAERLRRMKCLGDPNRPEAPEARVALRRLMEAMQAWRHCGIGKCRRERICASPFAECGWRKLPWMQRDILPPLRRLCGAAADLAATPEGRAAAMAELEAGLKRAGRPGLRGD
ncbi:MAG: hypothetical protein KGM42_13040 [Hyphomicrobiales bacterium]|nr:hypothetical protein [Hyphomicrobiales bacterium]